MQKVDISKRMIFFFKNGRLKKMDISGKMDFFKKLISEKLDILEFSHFDSKIFDPVNRPLRYDSNCEGMTAYDIQHILELLRNGFPLIS